MKISLMKSFSPAKQSFSVVEPGKFAALLNFHNVVLPPTHTHHEREEIPLHIKNNIVCLLGGVLIRRNKTSKK
jgi:hypothetical protein